MKKFILIVLAVVSANAQSEFADKCAESASSEMSECAQKAAEPDDFMKCVESDLTKNGLKIGDVRFQERYCEAILIFTNQYCERDLSNAGMTQCALAETGIYDKVLNQKYKIALAKIDEEIKEGYRDPDKSRALFIDAQKKWWQYKDAHCLLPLGTGGTMEYPMMAACQAKLAKERLEYLEEFILPTY